jgi:hypothetical protein
MDQTVRQLPRLCAQRDRAAVRNVGAAWRRCWPLIRRGNSAWSSQTDLDREIFQHMTCYIFQFQIRLAFYLVSRIHEFPDEEIGQQFKYQVTA